MSRIIAVPQFDTLGRYITPGSRQLAAECGVASPDPQALHAQAVGRACWHLIDGTLVIGPLS
jgi:hypothetical protein